MILVWLIGTLLIGGWLSLIAGRWRGVISRWISLITLFGCLVAVSLFWITHKVEPGALTTWVVQYRQTWIPSFGITFHLAVDGFSLLLLILTFFLGVLATLCSWREVTDRVGFFHFNLLWIIAGISGVFMAMDLFLFYFFWELMLIPMYFLIGIWGSEKRVYAAFKFFIFTQASGLLMFIAIIGLYLIHGKYSGTYTFNYFELLGTQLSFQTALWLMLGFLIAFAVKLPLVPFHSWLPDAHSEAPTAGSLILAGLLLKTGAYGMIRFAVPLFPQVAVEIAPWAMALGVVGIIYGAILSFAQTDLKRLVAYTSISHMGFVMLGIFAFNSLALQGVVLQIITHALSTGALFILAGMLKERLHTRDMELMGGLWSSMPRMGAVGLFFALASLGLPGMGNFLAEFLTLLGSFQASVAITVVASLGLILSTIYALYFVQKVFWGPQTYQGKLKDFSWRELIIMSLLCVATVGIGFFPQPIVNSAKPMVNQLQQLLTGTAESRDSNAVTEKKTYDAGHKPPQSSKP